MLIGKILMSPFVDTIIAKYGLRYGNLVALACFIVGSILRVGILLSINFVYLGQLFFGFGAVFIISSHMEFCFNWFHPKVRGNYLTFLSLGMTLGGTLSLIYPRFFIEEKAKNSELASEEI